MFRSVQDFLKSYYHLRAGTSRVLESITDEHLDQEVAPGHRTVGEIAWHIVVTIPEMMGRTGLELSSVDHTAPPPGSAREIAEAYGRASKELMEALDAAWTDDTLLESDDMYGQTWSRGVSLMALIGHEAHHRGQLTVLLRQAGAEVPGVYGPAKHEWAKYGAEPPAY